MLGQACSEMDYIIKHLDSELKDKVPTELKEFFYNFKDEEYEVKLDVEKNLYDQELKSETRAILAYLNEEYFEKEQENFEDTFRKSCSEVKFILDNLDEESLSKIPNKFVEFFDNNKFENYEVKLDVKENLYDQDMQEETRAFLAIICEKYLVDSSEDNSKQVKVQETISNNEKVIAKEVVINEEQNKTENMQMIVKKENIFVNWFKKLLSFFKK